jgi:hypothetical protein
VLKLTLHQRGFDYEYMQTTDGTDAIVADSGQACQSTLKSAAK